MATARLMVEAASDAAPIPRSPAVLAGLKTELVGLMPNLRAFARSLCSNAAMADDLVQEALMKGLANIERFEPGSNLRAWMFTILRNTYYSDMRKRQREVQDSEGAHAARLAERPNQNGVADLEDFKEAFAKLSSDHREVLTLVGAAGMSYEEAADICACPVGTIKSRVNRARARLAELLGLTVEEAGLQDGTDMLPGNLIPGRF